MRDPVSKVKTKTQRLLLNSYLETMCFCKRQGDSPRDVKLCRKWGVPNNAAELSASLELYFKAHSSPANHNLLKVESFLRFA